MSEHGLYSDFGDPIANYWTALDESDIQILKTYVRLLSVP